MDNRRRKINCQLRSQLYIGEWHIFGCACLKCKWSWFVKKTKPKYQKNKARTQRIVQGSYFYHFSDTLLDQNSPVQVVLVAKGGDRSQTNKTTLQTIDWIGLGQGQIQWKHNEYPPTIYGLIPTKNAYGRHWISRPMQITGPPRKHLVKSKKYINQN